MAGFMNAELVKIRDNLVCGHCECKFVGSDSQARKVKYEACIVYCSSTCRHAMMRKKFSTPAPNRGPCTHCKDILLYEMLHEFRAIPSTCRKYPQKITRSTVQSQTVPNSKERERCALSRMWGDFLPEAKNQNNKTKKIL